MEDKQWKTNNESKLYDNYHIVLKVLIARYQINHCYIYIVYN